MAGPAVSEYHGCKVASRLAHFGETSALPQSGPDRPPDKNPNNQFAVLQIALNVLIYSKKKKS